MSGLLGTLVDLNCKGDPSNPKDPTRPPPKIFLAGGSGVLPNRLLLATPVVLHDTYHTIPHHLMFVFGASHIGAPSLCLQGTARASPRVGDAGGLFLPGRQDLGSRVE